VSGSEYILIDDRWVDPNPPIEVALFHAAVEVSGKGYVRKQVTAPTLYGRHDWHAGAEWGTITHAAWFLNGHIIGVLDLGSSNHVSSGDTVSLDIEKPFMVH
jgi:hypothetical protein